ncbi:polysaccharide deacetylase family protein [Hornefia butyriciproducens]|nr:polysaccharide deacetylase [Hornefia butyriciproducens]
MMELERPVWPQGNRCAAAVTLNLNAELFWLDLDPDCADKPKTLSLGQYGMNRGIDRILDILEERKLRATAFVPGWVAEHYADTLRSIAERGHEIGVMGSRDENMALYTKEEQKHSLKKSIETVERVCGTTPRGFRTPQGELTLETLQAAKELGLAYSSNLSCDDRPCEIDLGNGETMTEIPIHWVNYDLPYFAFNYHPAFPAGQGRIANYTGVLDNWIDEFDGAAEYGLCYVLQLDPAMIGAPGRTGLLEELLDHMQSEKDVWFATCGEIAEYSKKQDE